MKIISETNSSVDFLFSSFQLQDFATDSIRLDLDLRPAGTACQIDAIQIFGNIFDDHDENNDNKVNEEDGDVIDQWASVVLGFSSQYSDSRCVPDSNGSWANDGPTSGRQYRRWANVGPTYIAVWGGWS